MVDGGWGRGERILQFVDRARSKPSQGREGDSCLLTHIY